MTKEKANRNEVVGMFLTYCRKTLVNARTDVLRERKRRRNREVLFCDLRRSELESLADWQDVPERETVFDAAGKPIGVTDKDLADALEHGDRAEQCEHGHVDHEPERIVGQAAYGHADQDDRQAVGPCRYAVFRLVAD